jgi:hypothetical protein
MAGIPKKKHSFRCSDEEIRNVFWLYRNGMPQNVIAKHTEVSSSTISEILASLKGNLDYDYTLASLPPIPNVEEILAIRYMAGFLHELELVRTVCPQCRHSFVVIKHSIDIRCIKCLHPFKLKVINRPKLAKNEGQEVPNITNLGTPNSWLDE